MRVIQLYPNAIVIDYGNGKKLLQSYQTVVAGFINGEVKRFWDGRTNTTSKHIKMFLEYLGVNMTVKQFYRITK